MAVVDRDHHYDCDDNANSDTDDLSSGGANVFGALTSLR
jgi:hypothetical protein